MRSATGKINAIEFDGIKNTGPKPLEFDGFGGNQ